MTEAQKGHDQAPQLDAGGATAPETLIDRLVEGALLRTLVGNPVRRRQFLRLMGSGAAAALLGSVLPLDAAKALAQEKPGPIEKKDLKVGFIPITCATPIIMAEPMGFYKKHGLNVQVVKASGWAMIRDLAINKETDATHMLMPMPLALHLGLGSAKIPWLLPAVENINGQAITLAMKHKGVKGPQDFKGFKMAVPFDYSMHNLLLRYYLANSGVDPDKDIQIRVVPPPEMVANLRAGNLDGYLGPDPFNQRAVYEGVGFIFKLSKDLWPNHADCAFACSQEFATTYPNTFHALVRALVDATHFSAKAENRREIAKAVAPRNYLNQPVEVIEAVLTGNYEDGLGGRWNIPDRVNFDPYPWKSFGVWILTQLKRWGYLKGGVDYRQIVDEVFQTALTGRITRELGYEAPTAEYKQEPLFAGAFDPEKPEEYLASFAIRRS
ncbi:MAG: CmpA/NrtA family ABC transporter substrate-binding protein [Candidatus Entotheonellia bacterium]